MTAEHVEHGDMVRDPRDVWPDDVPLGTFEVRQHGVQGYPAATASILFVCPNGRRCGVLLGPAQVDRAASPGGRLHIWAWDGNVERPTLTPSIDCKSEFEGKPAGCGWHGHITNGVMQ